jgi:hypothetical protein
MTVAPDPGTSRASRRPAGELEAEVLARSVTGLSPDDERVLHQLLRGTGGH